MKVFKILFLLFSIGIFGQNNTSGDAIYNFPKIKSSITMPVTIPLSEISNMINASVKDMIFQDDSYTDNDNDQFKVNSTNTSPILAVVTNIANCINIDRVSQAVTEKIIDLTSRTAQQISNEKQIVDILTGHLKQTDSNVQMIPFGSTTYGFGGSDTNFNILIVPSKRHTYSNT